jgi:hypothetical protein
MDVVLLCILFKLAYLPNNFIFEIWQVLVLTFYFPLFLCEYSYLVPLL